MLKKNILHKAQDVIQTKIDGKNILLKLETGKYLELNETASDIWDLIDDGIIISSLVGKIAKKYKTEEKNISNDVHEFILRSEKLNIIILEDAKMA